jgi:hypothetical protein
VSSATAQPGSVRGCSVPGFVVRLVISVGLAHTHEAMAGIRNDLKDAQLSYTCPASSLPGSFMTRTGIGVTAVFERVFRLRRDAADLGLKLR